MKSRVSPSILIASLFTMLHMSPLDCKIIKSPPEHLDSLRPESNPLQNLKLKNSANVVVAGKRGERLGSLHHEDIVTAPSLKKSKKAKETLMKAAAVPHIGYLDSNYILGDKNSKKDNARSPSSVAKPSGLRRPTQGEVGAKRPETEVERAERINKQFEKMMQFTALLGHVDSFLYDRTKSVVKTLHRMMGNSREMVDAVDSGYDTNELRRRRHSDFHRTEPTGHRPVTREQHISSSHYEALPLSPQNIVTDEK